MSRVLIIGGGDLAKQINHYISVYDQNNEVVGFVDDTVPAGVERFGKRCLGSVNDIDDIGKDDGFDKLIIGFGYKHLAKRQEIFNRYCTSFHFYTFVHPRAFVDKSAAIGSGVIIGPNTVIEQRAQIGDNVFLYNSVNISHDSMVGGHTFIAPTVSIAGFVVIGPCCFLGINTTIIDNISITSNVMVGANALVVRDIDQAGTYIGQPCKKITAHDSI